MAYIEKNSEEQISSLMIYAIRHKLTEYLQKEFREQINKKIDDLVEEAVREFSINAEAMRDVFSLDTKVVVKTLFNGKEMPK